MVGVSLRNLRKARGWSAREVGDAMGMVGQNIYRHEQGERSLSIYYLLKYERLYNVSIERIIYGEKIRSKKSPAPSKVLLEFDD